MFHKETNTTQHTSSFIRYTNLSESENYMYIHNFEIPVQEDNNKCFVVYISWAVNTATSICRL